MKIGIDVFVNSTVVKIVYIDVDDKMFSTCCPAEQKRLVQERVDKKMANALDWKWFYKKEFTFK